MTLMTIALIVLAAGIALFGITLLFQAQLRDRNAAAVETAINPVQRKIADTPDPDQPRSLLDPVKAWLVQFGQQFQGNRMEELLLDSTDRLLLDRCDRNTAAGRAAYMALRLLLAVIVMVLAAVSQRSVLLILIAALLGFAVGLFFPKWILSIWAKNTARRADKELPLMVDLLRLLQGIGMSMDQSLHVIAEQFRNTVPLLGHELHLANVSYNRGRSRKQSLERLTRVYDTNDDLKALVRLIVQVDEHGGAVQEPLNQFGTRLRQRRKTRMKEASGKLSVKMTMVMMLTLLPALMLFLAGPAAIALSGAIGHFSGG